MFMAQIIFESFLNCNFGKFAFYITQNAHIRKRKEINRKTLYINRRHDRNCIEPITIIAKKKTKNWWNSNMKIFFVSVVNKSIIILIIIIIINPISFTTDRPVHFFWFLWFASVLHLIWLFHFSLTGTNFTYILPPFFPSPLLVFVYVLLSLYLISCILCVLNMNINNNQTVAQTNIQNIDC